MLRPAPTEATPLVPRVPSAAPRPGAEALAAKRWPRFCSVASLARAVTCGSSTAEGYDLGIFSATVLPVIREFGLRPYQVSLLAGVPVLIMSLVTPIAGICMDTVGRKPVIGLSYVMLIVGSSMYTLAADFAVLLAARCIIMSGCSIGIITVTVYMAELSPSTARGMLVSLEEIFICVGLLGAILTGYVLISQEIAGWRSVAAAGAVLPALCLALLALPAIPESPRFRQHQGRAAEARAILDEILAGDNDEAERVLRAWREEAVEQAAREAGRKEQAFCSRLRSSCAALARRSILLACGAFLAKVLSGHVAIGSYVVIFMASRVGEAEGLKWAVAMQVMKLAALFPACLYLLDRHGRRPLLTASAAGCALALSVVALGFQFGFPPWVMGLGFSAFAFSFSFGYGPVVWVYVSEILPMDVRGTAMGLITLPTRAIEMVLVSSAPLLFAVDSSLLFWSLAAANVCAAAFFALLCPETRGFVLEDVKMVFA